MNYPVWPDSASYSRSLLGNGTGMRSSLVPGAQQAGGEDKCAPANKYAASNGPGAGSGDAQRTSRMGGGEECGSAATGPARGHQLAAADKYAPLSSFVDDDSMLKVSPLGSGRPALSSLSAPLSCALAIIHFLIPAFSPTPSVPIAIKRARRTCPAAREK